MFFSSHLTAFCAEKKFQDSLTPIESIDELFEDQLKKFVGIPYRWGGTTEKGLDCSGFVRLVYDRFLGIDLPHSSLAQFRFNNLEKVDEKEMHLGDLIFFCNKNKKINHVGVYISDNQFIHASSSEGIRVSSLNDRYWKRRFVGTKRLSELRDGLDPDRFRFESLLEVPIHENGTLTSYRRDDFSIISANVVENPAHDLFSLSDSRLHMHEIGYTYSALDKFGFKLSTIHENFEVMTPLPALDPLTRKVNLIADESSFETADRMGFKVTGAFQPSSWFRISPSVTYFDYESQFDDIINVPSWVFGLNTILFPAHKQWALSMGLQYSEKEDFKNLSLPYSRYSSLDLVIKLGINISESMKLSLMGEYDEQSIIYGMPGDSLLMDSINNNISMSLDFTY